jgi:hypothetical protein
MNLDHSYNKEELQAITQKMRNTANRVYVLLQSCEVHAFIEFNGLMQKYVDLCQRASDAGVDFTMFNTHNDRAFTVHAHDIEYMAEKFDCIFGPLFRRNLVLWDLFKKKLELP